MKINILYQITSLFAYIFPFTEKQHVNMLDNIEKPMRFRMGLYRTIDLILISLIAQPVRY